VFACQNQYSAASKLDLRGREVFHPNRRQPVSSSSLALKYGSIRRRLHVQFHALLFAVHGPYLKTEACHRKINLQLLIDAAREILDRDMFREFTADVQAELNCDGKPAGMR
jgi:hypothetical protein